MSAASPLYPLHEDWGRRGRDPETTGKIDGRLLYAWTPTQSGHVLLPCAVPPASSRALGTERDIYIAPTFFIFKKGISATLIFFRKTSRRYSWYTNNFFFFSMMMMMAERERDKIIGWQIFRVWKGNEPQCRQKKKMCRHTMSIRACCVLCLPVHDRFFLS